jgi:hypothetical protein
MPKVVRNHPTHLIFVSTEVKQSREEDLQVMVCIYPS